MQENNLSPREYIVHLCPSQDWRKAKASEDYRAASLEEEGFIHCSRPDQILEVANRFYRQVPDLVLLWIDPLLVLHEIRYERPEPETQQDFPHIYGPLNIDAVISVCSFPLHRDGFYRSIPSPE